ncbi:MAG: phosphoribosylformylglycinamidine synthase, partial [Gammaproteobacteria bacterium]|nr:phosphoribosylformylglycinamidine synthase [Gammaproteobacteria bacterium]
AACGGFSFGDVLGAGEGWAKSILFNPRLRDTFSTFFHRSDTFALGVCNGCQMMSTIKSLIPGAEHWPEFVRNDSEQYEARFVTVQIESEKSILMKGMAGSRIAVSTAHGEGRAWFADPQSLDHLASADQVAMRFVDNSHQVTERYPLNPNGSPGGVTGFTSNDGRFTIMMPHPERVFRSVTHSWHPRDWQEDSPWMRLFYNARVWVG